MSTKSLGYISKQQKTQNNLSNSLLSSSVSLSPKSKFLGIRLYPGFGQMSTLIQYALFTERVMLNRMAAIFPPFSTCNSNVGRKNSAQKE